MDYEKKYPHPTLRNETIFVKWISGYGRVEIWYHDRLVKEISSGRALVNKVHFEDDELGEVEIYLSQNPYLINLKVDGIHSIVNSEHPSKSIHNLFYWMIPGSVIHGFIGVIFGSILLTQGAMLRENIILSIYHLFFFAIFLGTLILVRKNYPMWFLLGLSVHWIEGILFVLMAVASYSFEHLPIAIPILILIYFTYCAFMTRATLKLVPYWKHRRFNFSHDDKIIDD